MDKSNLKGRLRLMAGRLLLLAKGALIGTGFLLPGVSGGALAAIFGLYGRLVTFLAHPVKNFKRDVHIFIPVLLGLLFGIVLLSYPLSFLMANAPVPTTWFFIGAMAGTFPSLWKEAGKKGRKAYHYIITVVAFIIGYAFLAYGSSLFEAKVEPSLPMWALSGALIALGILLPGFSPSNFLLYLGLYDGMVDAIKSFDFLVLLPMLLGGLLCLIALSKLINWVLGRAYTGLFHMIFGVVAASTIKIIPLNYDYLHPGALLCLLTVAAGIALGLWMGRISPSGRAAKE